MGLDCYLYEYFCDPDKVAKLQQTYDEKAEALWREVFGAGSYQDASEEKKAEYTRREEELSAGLGLEKHGRPPDAMVKAVSFKDPRFPDHMFEIGYFRSSYNATGINYILSDRIGTDLYQIFNLSDADEAASFSPDWEAVRENAVQARDAFAKWREENGDTQVIDVGRGFPLDPKGLPNSREALEVYAKEKASHAGKEAPFGGSYSTASGSYFWDGLTVTAAIHGRNVFDERTTFLVVETDNEDESPFEWYEQALSIVVSTCDYVIARPESTFRCVWSG